MITDEELDRLEKSSRNLMVPSHEWQNAFTAPVIQAMIAELKEFRALVKLAKPQAISNTPKRCPQCGGSGSVPDPYMGSFAGNFPVDCPKCNGSGWE